MNAADSKARSRATANFYRAAGRSGDAARQSDDRLQRLTEYAERLTEADFRPLLDAAAAEIGAEPADAYLLDGRWHQLRGASSADQHRVSYIGTWVRSKGGVRYPRLTARTFRHGGQSIVVDGWPALIDLFERGSAPRPPAPATRPAPADDPAPDREAAAAARAARLWASASADASGHPYLARKHVGSHGLRLLGDKLVMPLRDLDGRLWSLQFIDGAGNKLFLRGGRTRACFHRIGRPDGVPEVLLIGEGYATCASAHEATGHPAACAHSAGNLLAVAKALRSRYSDADMILLADDDPAGRTACERAARAVNGRVAAVGGGH